MLEKMKDSLPQFECEVCRKTSEAYQLSVYEDIEFLACQHCGSVTASPIPGEDFIRSYIDSSRAAQFSPFPHNLEKKHYINHIQDLKQMAKGPAVVDLNCHNGYRTELARMKAFPNIKGIDSNRYSIEIAQKRFPKNDYKNETLAQLALGGETFDVAISYHGLENTNSPDDYLQDLRKILNDNAVVYFTLCNGNHFMVPSNFLNWKEVRYPDRVFYYSTNGLDALLKRNGFKIIKRYFRFLPYHNVIVRIKK